MDEKLGKGLQALYASDLAKAEEQFNKIIKNDPLNAEAYFYRGKTHWQNGNLTAAMSDFSKTLSINPLHNQATVSLEMVKNIMGFRNPDLLNP
ncbi:MAG: tetratricopeptide repeat protein [Bacteroidales bacterium]|jgi:Tfp pilus assembly protein PilF|nr:tetratricopeptide repeat protein [Bacteroidales bacterium]MDD4383807.1 tetratricopeptide repeat protein [Bacteroidales bacterium]MDY0197991.1 tetratricopeptide repeat protein [Tenuifilaceae bacterium]